MKLVYLEGPDKGKGIDIPVREFSIGRAEDNDLSLSGYENFQLPCEHSTGKQVLDAFMIGTVRMELSSMTAELKSLHCCRMEIRFDLVRYDFV